MATNLKNKALMYVFGKRHRNIVAVDVGTNCYYVINENCKCQHPGRYIVEYPFSELNGIDKEIEDAVFQLEWIAEGNEFPEHEQQHN